MNEIKHTPGPWYSTISGFIYDHRSHQIAEVFSGSTWSMDANAKLIAAAPDMAEILEIIAADADAGEILMTSGVRAALDAALIKAGRKAAPEPVRHITVNGGV